MYLNKIVGSKTKVNGLAVLLSKADRSYLESELAKESGSSVSEISRQMRDLVDSGLVIMERVGRTKVYRVNSKHFLFEPLKNLFRNLEGVYREIAEIIVEFVTERYNIKAIILFGSLSKGKIRSDIVREPSDIDLVIVAENNQPVQKIKSDLLNFINSEISLSYGIAAYPIVLTLDDYVAELGKDRFVINVHSKGELIYGEKPRRFG